jgi:serine phosphatase RsbU (regulator of sigma subunit)
VGWLGVGPRVRYKDYSSADAKILGAVAAQAAPLVRACQFAQRQQAQALERERLEHELALARLIQQRLLPEALPDWSGWQAAARYQPARAVGGDFYDFVPYPDGRVGVVIGDVSGKGMPAALVMATTRANLRAAAGAAGGAEPGAVLRRTNELLLPTMPPSMFVTCLYAVLDPLTGWLRYANAGHSLPYRLSGQSAALLCARGMPLGLLPDMLYEENETRLAPGEALLLHSDGLAEAHSPGGEMFGDERLRALLAGMAGAPRAVDAAAVLARLLAQLTAFTGPEAEPEDDVTLVLLRRLAAERA